MIWWSLVNCGKTWRQIFFLIFRLLLFIIEFTKSKLKYFVLWIFQNINRNVHFFLAHGYNNTKRIKWKKLIIFQRYQLYSAKMKVHCSSPQETGDFWNLLFCTLSLHRHTSFLQRDIYSSTGVWDSRYNQVLYTHELQCKLNLKFPRLR